MNDDDQGPTRSTYSVPEVARILGLGRGIVYELVRQGQIPALRCGSRWIIPRRRFHAWLDAADPRDGADSATPRARAPLGRAS